MSLLVSRREVVLILQIGSLGDTVVSLPCYREIARRHPYADRYLLSNYAIGTKMVPAEAIVSSTGMICGSISYPMPLRHMNEVFNLRCRIRALQPSVLYYLLPEVKTLRLIRHFLFFKSCGVPRIIGMPWSRPLRHVREVIPGILWESEASRLSRTIGAASGAPSDADRDLVLSYDEWTKANAVLKELGTCKEFIAVSVGGKIPVNNWGDQNWSSMLNTVSRRRPGLGAVFVGSADEKPRTDALATAWRGPSLNSCGRLTPRETAALIARAQAFVGHDTGTLHLAGAVNTPIVGIFSARNRPGKWYSDRARDTFFYKPMPCAGCELVEIEACQHGRACIMSHEPAAVAESVLEALVISSADQASDFRK